MTDNSAKPVALRQKRDATIATLCEHFALDNIEADQLESLIDQAHLARTADELDALLTGLPTASQSPTLDVLPAAQVEKEALIVAVMGGSERKGAWSVARTNRVIAVMGGAMLDFRSVRLPPGTTEVQILAIMGGVEIIVPPEMRVSSDGIGIMGGFEHAGDPDPAGAGANAPLLRVTGLALMGGVEITQRKIGENAADARRRRRSESKLRGAEHKRRLERGEEF
jgi:hypothetical protein